MKYKYKYTVMARGANGYEGEVIACNQKSAINKAIKELGFKKGEARATAYRVGGKVK